MDGLTDDEALQIAIKMSLEEQSSSVAGQQSAASGNAEVIDLTESEATWSSSQNAHTDSNHQPSGKGASSTIETPSMGILGLDRRKMEQERLARLGQRPRTTKSISPPPISRDSERTAKRRKVEHSSGATSATPDPAITGDYKIEPTALRFPNGVIKRTWARSRLRSNDVTIEEVLQRDKLRKAVLSSFQWDHEWLFKKLDIKNTDLLMVVQAKSQAEQDVIRAEGKSTNPRIKLCFPPMPGQVNCMHSKLMLLFYDSYMRIVVPSANLTEYDWGDDNRMENMVFLIDLPGPLDMADSELQLLEKMPTFARSLHYFLQRMDVPTSLLDALRRYDFTNTKRLAFVHTV